MIADKTVLKKGLFLILFRPDPSNSTGAAYPYCVFFGTYRGAVKKALSFQQEEGGTFTVGRFYARRHLRQGIVREKNL
jgi:hypothetical protein